MTDLKSGVIGSKSLCDDCVHRGRCSFAESLSLTSVPLRSLFPVTRPSNRTTPNLPITNPAAWFHPDSFKMKLRHEKCPFHHLQSVGCELYVTRSNRLLDLTYALMSAASD